MGRWTISEPQRLTLDEPIGRLDVHLVSGRLNVVGTDGPARIEIATIGRKPIDVSILDGRLKVGYDDFPSGSWMRWTGPFWWFLYGRRRYHADVSIAVPHETAAELRLVSGSLVASGLRAGARVDLTSGRVTLLGLDGRVKARAISGPIEALGVAGDLSIETVSGELLVADSTAERVYAKTVSGSIIADLDNPPKHSDIKLETVSGEVTARVREDSDLDVHLHAISGRVTSAFRELHTDTMPGTKNIRGVLGLGSGRLTVNTTSGSISLLRRPVDWSDET